METFKTMKNELQDQVAQLQKLAIKWSGKYAKGTDKDMNEKILDTIDKANKIIGVKYRQYSTKLKVCETATSELEDRLKDNLRFWDLLIIEIEDVKEKFEEIEKIRKHYAFMEAGNGERQAPARRNSTGSDSPRKKIMKKH